MSMKTPPHPLNIRTEEELFHSSFTLQNLGTCESSGSCIFFKKGYETAEVGKMKRYYNWGLSLWDMMGGNNLNKYS